MHDPYDAGRVAEINRSLKDFGFCLVLPGLSFSGDVRTTDRYCEAPQHTLRSSGAPDLNYRHTLSEALVKQGPRRGEGGIFYRPRLTQPVHVMIRDKSVAHSSLSP